MVSFESQTYSKKLLHLISWSHWFTFFNIVAAILLSTVYLINEATPETLVGHIYLTVTWLSHMAFLTFITYVLTVFPLTLLIPRTRFIRVFASIIFTVALLLLCLDAFIYNRLGYHINASSISQIIALISEEIREDRRAFWFISIVLTLFILTFELIISNYAWKHLQQLQKTIFVKFVVFGLITAFFMSHLTHIWADANLEYDVLKQDTILPLSYPTTAKTLLTKYELFNKDDYIKRRNSSLSFNEQVPKYPTLNEQCSRYPPKNSTYIVVTQKVLSSTLIDQFAQRSTVPTVKLTHHIDNAIGENAWFNLFYGLPTIYQSSIQTQNMLPILFQALVNHDLPLSFTVIGHSPATKPVNFWFDKAFAEKHYVDNITNMIMPSAFTNFEKGLHVIYFTQENSYQLELFIDALLLNQKQKQIKDNIFISSIGNKNTKQRLSIKPALAILPNAKSAHRNTLTSQMDIAPTLFKSWLACEGVEHYFAGNDILSLTYDRVIANTVENGMVIFNKDKSVFVDQHGNFQSYSRQLASPISVNADLPLMIDGVHFIKRYAQATKNK